MSQAARIQVLSVGHALDTDSAGFGIVHSVFARAVNLMLRAEMWTLLAADRADLPFGIRVAPADLDVLGLRNGDPVNVRVGFVSIGSGSICRVVDCRGGSALAACAPQQDRTGFGWSARCRCDSRVGSGLARIHSDGAGR